MISGQKFLGSSSGTCSNRVASPSGLWYPSLPLPASWDPRDIFGEPGSDLLPLSGEGPGVCPSLRRRNTCDVMQAGVSENAVEVIAPASCPVPPARPLLFWWLSGSGRASERPPQHRGQPVFSSLPGLGQQPAPERGKRAVAQASGLASFAPCAERTAHLVGWAWFVSKNLEAIALLQPENTPKPGPCPSGG